MQLTEERDVLRGQLAAETKRADATGANPHINLPTSLLSFNGRCGRRV